MKAPNLRSPDRTANGPLSAIGWLAVLAAGPLGAQPDVGERIIDPRDVIALEAGVWDASIMSPDGSRVIATGVQINEVRSEGMWMLNRMSANGGKYEGTGIWGYDPATGRYMGSWADNGLPGIRVDKGEWDPDTRTMSWTSETRLADGKVRRIRATSTFAGGTRTYRSFAITDAGEVLRSVIVFVRRPQSSR